MCAAAITHGVGQPEGESKYLGGLFISVNTLSHRVRKANSIDFCSRSCLGEIISIRAFQASIEDQQVSKISNTRWKSR